VISEEGPGLGLSIHSKELQKIRVILYQCNGYQLLNLSPCAMDQLAPWNRFLETQTLPQLDPIPWIPKVHYHVHSSPKQNQKIHSTSNNPVAFLFILKLLSHLHVSK
jgi:hypothetical protein